MTSWPEEGLFPALALATKWHQGAVTRFSLLPLRQLLDQHTAHLELGEVYGQSSSCLGQGLEFQPGQLRQEQEALGKVKTQRPFWKFYYVLTKYVIYNRTGNWTRTNSSLSINSVSPLQNRKEILIDFPSSFKEYKCRHFQFHHLVSLVSS